MPDDNTPVTRADLAQLAADVRTAISESELRLIDLIKAEKAEAMEEFRAYSKQQTRRWISMLLAAGDNAKTIEAFSKRVEYTEEQLRRVDEMEERLRRLERAS
jgi:hypothetical protein